MESPIRTEEALFDAARRLSEPSARQHYLDGACPDPAVRARVEALLRVHDSEPSFLRPGPGFVPTVDLPAASERPGTLIGPYKLLELVGEGGMGEVWLAEQTHPVRRQVAVKLIKPGMDTRQVVARFEAERQALALMDHPNIARVFDGGTTDRGRPFFVMELVRGVPVTRYADDHRLPVADRLGLFADVCRAVQHAHQKGVIHRDLKPSNVLVSAHDGRPAIKVIDFGVAKAVGQSLTDKTLFTAFGAVVGTPEYMSPEQAELNNPDVDTRSDVYALGVLLYELLAGSTPLTRQRVKGAAVLEVLRLVREEDPPRPSTRLSSSDELAGIAARRRLEPKRLTRVVHGELDWIVMKCLEKERVRRYETANQLALDVQRYLADEPVLAGPPSARYRLRKFLRRNRGPALAAALLAVALVAGAGVSAWQAVRARRGLGRAEAEAFHARQAERAAEDQRAVTAAVNAFWHHDVLEQANPDAEGRFELLPDKDIKMRTVLDRAAARIPGRFPGQPLVEAAVRLVVGDAYFGLSEYDLAASHLEAAYAIRVRELGDDHPDTSVARKHLMRAYVPKFQMAKIEPLHRKELDVLRRTLGPDHPDTLQSENELGVRYQLLQRHAEAEAVFRRILDVRSQQLGPDHPDTLLARVKLAGHFSHLGRHAEAEPILKRVLDVCRETGTDDHDCALEARNILAGRFESRREFAEAEPLHLRNLETYRRRWGDNSPKTQQVEFGLSGFYLRSRQYAKAEPLLVRRLDDMRKRLGDDHTDTAELKLKLAELCRAQGQPARAESLLVEAEETLRRKLGDDQLGTLLATHALADLYWFAGRHAEAVPVLERLVGVRRRQLGGDDPLVLICQDRLADSYEAVGRSADAGAVASRSLESRRRALAKDHPLTLRTVERLAALHQAGGQYARAEPLWQEVLDGRRRIKSADPVLLAGALANLGLCLLKQDRWARAEPVLRECLAVREVKQPDAWTTFNTRSMLGGALAGLRRYPEAEPLLLTGYEGMKRRGTQIPATAGERVSEALERLVHLYEALDRKDEVAKWRTELARGRPPVEAGPPPREVRP